MTVPQKVAAVLGLTLAAFAVAFLPTRGPAQCGGGR